MFNPESKGLVHFFIVGFVSSLATVFVLRRFPSMASRLGGLDKLVNTMWPF